MTAGNNSVEREECRPNRRVYPRYPVDCAATITVLTGAGQISGRLVDLSLGGCRLATEQRVLIGIMVRVEVQFQLLGIAFRVVGVAAGTRTGKSFAIRFLDMPKRRYDELVEVIAEVEAAAALKASTSASPVLAASGVIEGHGQAEVALASSKPDTSSQGPASQAPSNQPPAAQLTPAASGDRRSHSRHSVDTRAKLLLVKGGISMSGRILNLSQGGCRLRTDERFNVGIYVRVEAEFYLHGMPFRLAGVSQAILDKNTIGVRFLDMSERRREQLTELMAEIVEAERCSVAI
jgi:c-di-GMP-binding flagellar brake protein YcgR